MDRRLDYDTRYEQVEKWIKEQDGYYVEYEEFKKQARKREVELKDLSGITMLVSDDKSMIPKRDARKAIVAPGEHFDEF